MTRVPVREHAFPRRNTPFPPHPLTDFGNALRHGEIGILPWMGRSLPSPYACLPKPIYR